MSISSAWSIPSITILESSILLVWVLLEMLYNFLQHVLVAFVCNISQFFCSYRPLINLKRFIKSLIYIFDKFSNEETNLLLCRDVRHYLKSWHAIHYSSCFDIKGWSSRFSSTWDYVGLIYWTLWDLSKTYIKSNGVTCFNLCHRLLLWSHKIWWAPSVVVVKLSFMASNRSSH